MQKPEAQTLGVSGIEPKPVHTIDPNQNNWPFIWPRLAALPPFQMFIGEMVPDPARGDAYQWALHCVYERAQGESTEYRNIIEEYCQWHSDKGYWPGENPTDNIISNCITDIRS